MTSTYHREQDALVAGIRREHLAEVAAKVDEDCGIIEKLLWARERFPGLGLLGARSLIEGHSGYMATGAQPGDQDHPEFIGFENGTAVFRIPDHPDWLFLTGPHALGYHHLHGDERVMVWPEKDGMDPVPLFHCTCGAVLDRRDVRIPP